MDRRGFLGLATGSIWGREGGTERVAPPGGGRVTRRVTEYLTNNAVYNVRDFGALGDGTDDGPAIRRALEAAGPHGGTLLFPPGTYSYDRSPNFAQNNLEIVGRGKVTLRHTGKGVGFLVDGWLKKFGRRVWNMRIENLMLEGSPDTSVGFLFRSVHHGHYSRLRVTGGAPAGEGFRTEFFIANYCESWCVTGSEPVVGSLPAVGITMTSLETRENLSTADCTLTNFIVEGCAHVGVHLDRAQHNLIRGGTFEDNHTGTGLLVSESASGNVVDGVFLESNGLHIDCRGPQNQFLGLSAAKGLCRVHRGGSFSRLIGGRFGDIAIEHDVHDVKLFGVAVSRMVDKGQRTQRLGCYDLKADLPIRDHNGYSSPTTSWIAPVLELPCADAEGDSAPVGFRREADGAIRLRGRLIFPSRRRGKRRPFLLFTLPDTHRPRYRHRLPVLSGGKLGILEVEPSGRVVLVKGTMGDIVLDGLVLAEEGGEV